MLNKLFALTFPVEITELLVLGVRSAEGLSRIEAIVGKAVEETDKMNTKTNCQAWIVSSQGFQEK